MSQSMLAAVFKGEGQLVLEERPVPEVRLSDDVLLEVEACGVCGTDLHICEVPPGHPATPDTILGHEYVGRVLATGEQVTGVRRGDRVVVAPNLYCGTCRYCRLGRPNQCEHADCIGIFRDGGFARFSMVPARAVYKIAEELPSSEAVHAELLSCVMGGTNKVRIQPGESAVILGAGPAGLMFLLAFKAAGAGPIIVFESGAYRRERARSLGADAVLDPGDEHAEEQVLGLTGLGADVVVDAVGTTLPMAVSLAACGGKVLLFGMNQQALPAVRQNDITRDELTIFGTYIGLNMFTQVIKALESGVIKPSALTTHTLPLERIHEGFAAARARKAVKVVLEP